MFKEKEIVIVKNGERIVAVGEVKSATKLRFTVFGSGYTAYSRKTGLPVGEDKDSPLTIHHSTTEEIAAARALIAQRQSEAADETEKQRKAAYDALPEAVKLARKIRYGVGDQFTEATVATMPIELLRAVAKWVDEQNDAHFKVTKAPETKAATEWRPAGGYMEDREEQP